MSPKTSTVLMLLAAFGIAYLHLTKPKYQLEMWIPSGKGGWLQVGGQ